MGSKFWVRLITDCSLDTSSKRMMPMPCCIFQSSLIHDKFLLYKPSGVDFFLFFNQEFDFIYERGPINNRKLLFDWNLDMHRYATKFWHDQMKTGFGFQIQTLPFTFPLYRLESFLPPKTVTRTRLKNQTQRNAWRTAHIFVRAKRTLTVLSLKETSHSKPSPDKYLSTIPKANHVEEILRSNRNSSSRADM